MRPSFSIILLIFGVCLLEFFASTEICSGNQYTVTDADGKFLKCQSCARCHAGYGLIPKCGSTVQSPVENISCKPCANGTFSNEYDSSPCYECQVCEEHQIVISYCNSQSDTNCSQTCDSGYYFTNDVSHTCHECSYCCDDEKDEVQPDCVKQGLEKRNQHCSHRVDKDCAPDLSTNISSSSGNGQKQLDLGKRFAIIFGVLFGVAVVVLVICAIIQKRRRSSDQGQIAGRVTHDQETLMTAARIEKNGNIVSQDAALPSHPTGSTPHPSVSRRFNPGFVPSNPGTPRVSPKVTSKGQIKIVQQPTSQNQTEGSRVEFTCKYLVQGNCEVCYQWFKDGTELQEQNNSSLILHSVKMHDFGCYRCCITPKGGHSEAVTSEPAVLEVAPCDGMRLKYLREVNLVTRDEVATRLENETPGLGGYRQIASKYGMKEHEVRGLVKSRQPGQDVMEFLRGFKPDLTVYSFCKTLKEGTMKRFDIVRVLDDDLSIKKENK